MLGALGGSAGYRGLGDHLLHCLGGCVGLGLGGFAGGLACGSAYGVGFPKRSGHGQQQRNSNHQACHGQTPRPQLLYSGS